MADRLPLRPPRDIFWRRHGYPFYKSSWTRDWDRNALGLVPFQLLFGGSRGPSLPEMWPPGLARGSHHVLPRLLLRWGQPVPVRLCRVACFLPCQSPWRNLHSGCLRPL